MKTLNTVRVPQAFSEFYFVTTTACGYKAWSPSRRVSRARARAKGQFTVHIAPTGKIQF
jgi:hypothetical protein